MQSGAADLGIAMITPFSERLLFEDYSQPFAVDRYVWVLPPASDVNWNNLWQSYHVHVWMAIGLALMFVFAYLVCESYLLYVLLYEIVYLLIRTVFLLLLIDSAVSDQFGGRHRSFGRF